MARADQAGNAINSPKDVGGDWKSRVKAMHGATPDAAVAGELLHVPGFITLSDLDRGNNLFFGVGRAVRRGIATFFWISLLALPAIWLWARFTPHITVAKTTAEILGALDFVFLYLTALYVAVAAVLLFFLFWLGATVFRLKPARVVTLRTAHVVSVSGVTRKMLRTEMRAYGHLIGVTKRNGQDVRSGSALAALARRLRHRTALNLRVPFARAEMLSVAPSEVWRPLTMKLLLGSADAIVIDLSDPKDSAWKLDAARAVAKRCVFIALWGRGEAAEAALQAAGITNPLHPYAPDGHMVDRAKFRAAMLGAMRASLS